MGSYTDFVNAEIGERQNQGHDSVSDHVSMISHYIL